MPSSTNNIWIDSSFESKSTNDIDSIVEYKVARADNIGEYTMPIVYRIPEPQTTYTDVKNTYFSQTTITGVAVNNVPIYYYTSSGIGTSIIDSETNVRFFPISYSGVINTNLSFFNTLFYLSASINVKSSSIIGNKYLFYSHVPVYYTTTSGKYPIIDILSKYTNFTGSIGTSGLPIPSYYTGINITNAYDVSFSGYIPSSLNVYNDITFAGWVDFNFQSDVYSTYSRRIGPFPADYVLTYGRNKRFVSDVFSTNVLVDSFYSSAYSSSIIMTYNISDSEVIAGVTVPIEASTYSCDEYNSVIPIDVNLFSLKISDLSVAKDNYIGCNDVIYVDVTDDVFGVSEVGSYFIIDGDVVSTSYTDITNGKRLSFSFGEDIASKKETILITVKATNNNNDELFKDFYVTFGYVVVYDNDKNNNGIDFGFKEKIPIRVTVEDFATCPSLSSLGWEFESKEKSSGDLGAFINGRLYSMEGSNVGASIYPTSAAYFYGKEITITLRVKDFAGNEMEPLVITYKIQDKP